MNLASDAYISSQKQEKNPVQHGISKVQQPCSKKHTKDSEEEENPEKEFKSLIIRMVNKVKEDMYKKLN
jgi:hypothetical protein